MKRKRKNDSGRNIWNSEENMEVKIEGDSSGLKKEMESSRQEVKRGVEAIQKETEKMKNPFRNLASSKTLSSVRASMKKIKDSFASFSLKDRTKEFQIKAGIKVPTEEYKNVISDIDKVQAKLDRYYERRDKAEYLGVDKESNSWRGLAYDIEGAERKLKMYQADKKMMETDGTDVQRPVSIKSMLGSVAVKGFGGALKGVTSGVKSLASGLIQKASGAFGALIQKFATGIPILKRTRSSFNGLGTSGKGLVGILKTIGMTAKFMFASFVIRGAINGAKEGFQNLAQYSSSTNASLSMLMSSLTQLKNSLATAFAPILDVVAPILNQFLQMTIRAVNAVGQLMGALTGKSTIVRAKKVNQDYAASLNGTSKGLKNNASNANKAQKEAEKYKRTLLGFDQINKMDDNSSSDTGSGGGADAGALGGIDNMFETTAVQSKFKDLAKLIKDSWKNADFTEVGAIVGRKLNAALQSIPWDEIKNTSNRIAKSIATFLNGFIETTDWGLVGSTLSQGLNTAIGFANTFAQNFHWTSLGKAISDGINGAVKTFDAATAGQTISNVVKGILDSFIIAVENTDWQQVGKKVQEFLVNIDWKGIVEKLSEAIGAAFGGFAAFLWGLIGDAWKKVVQWWKDTAYKDGQFTISGLFNGIVDALKNVATWIKDHIFKPFINGFKKAFGINSPSTVMIEQGGYIISGLFKGLKDNLPNVLKWVGDLPGKVKDKLGNAKEWLKEKGSQAMSGFAAGLHSINIPLPHITVSWNSHTVGPVSFSTPSFGLDWYAKGGFPNMGEMFVARENGPEMVGRMGRRNAVANNNQIVDGIRAGVYEAMVNALESFSGGENGQNTEVKIYLEGDSKKLFKVIRTEGQDYQKSTGKPVFE